MSRRGAAGSSARRASGGWRAPEPRWPDAAQTTRWCSSVSIRKSFCVSSSLSDVIGMPVQRAITSSMSSLRDLGRDERIFVVVCTQTDPPSGSVAGCHAKSCRGALDRPDPAFQSSILPCSRRTRSLTRAPASSITSIALSGRKRSGM